MSWLPKHNVVVPFDFSDQCTQAVQTAVQLTESPGDVTVLHVLPVLAAGEPGVVWEMLSDESRVEHAEAILKEKMQEAGCGEVNLTVTVGEPVHEIAAFAEEKGADLIVMPSHGRTGITRFLIGSVTERVTRLAHCPVLVMRH